MNTTDNKGTEERGKNEVQYPAVNNEQQRLCQLVKSATELVQYISCYLATSGRG